MLEKWLINRSVKSATDFQLEHIFWFTRNPIEFMSALRECRKRFGAKDLGITWLSGNQSLSRLYNVSHGFTEVRQS